MIALCSFQLAGFVMPAKLNVQTCSTTGGKSEEQFASSASQHVNRTPLPSTCRADFNALLVEQT
jgi:hypothetical protein